MFIILSFFGGSQVSNSEPNACYPRTLHLRAGASLGLASFVLFFVSRLRAGWDNNGSQVGMGQETRKISLVQVSCLRQTEAAWSQVLGKPKAKEGKLKQNMLAKWEEMA